MKQSRQVLPEVAPIQAAWLKHRTRKSRDKAKPAAGADRLLLQEAAIKLANAASTVTHALHPCSRTCLHSRERGQDRLGSRGGASAEG